VGITLKEVARLADVSVSTVSNIVNNKGKSYSEETKQKVLQILQDHKYMPNTAARALSGKKVVNIGLVVRDITRPFFAEMAKAIEKQTYETNCNLWICNTDGNLDKKKAYMETIRNKGLDGVIFVSLANVVRDELSEAAAYGVPIVIVDDPTKIKGCYNISVNHYTGVMKSTRYLIECGHQKIAYVGGDPARAFTRERMDAYRQVMKEAALSDTVISYHDLMRYNLQMVRELLSKGYTAFVAHNDNTAYWIYSYCGQHNIHVPKDLSIIGFDDLGLSSKIEPPLTTIRQPFETIAKLCVEYIHKRIEGIEPSPHTKRIEPRLIERGSVEKRML
jgi:LacI family transcriptional regulator